MCLYRFLQHILAVVPNTSLRIPTANTFLCFWRRVAVDKYLLNIDEMTVHA